MSSQTYQIEIKEKAYDVEVSGNGQEFSLDGKNLKLDLKGDAEKGFHLIHNNQSYRIHVLNADFGTKEITLEINDHVVPVKGADRFDLLLKDLGMEHLAGSAVNDLKAPMPGLVLDIKVKPGDSIGKGQALIVLEAMKMENVLKAESDAVVKSISCSQGDAVEKNQILIEFET